MGFLLVLTIIVGAIAVLIWWLLQQEAGTSFVADLIGHLSQSKPISSTKPTQTAVVEATVETQIASPTTPTTVGPPLFEKSEYVGMPKVAKKTVSARVNVNENFKGKIVSNGQIAA
ncbi:unnamed protein product [Caenorhabditis auriculariae]|uniref:Uncharacterized protein n=1 Tax=Caenorhabditis auriculariae TaxID=2777116 RepID=A0A8S1H1G8_9PELO|nr:unnamed protein product [Caenorhabditis auriculariae]